MHPTTHELESRLDACMSADRSRLRARLRSIARDRASPDAFVTRLVEDIDRSVERAERRRAALPKPTFPQELPVSEKRDDIARAIADNQVVILCGETGSGKTTQLPKICLELGRGVTGFIGHTQPRRIAARTVAARIAEELGSRTAVGCKVRFNDETQPDNFVKVMTDGILLAETQHDRDLDHYDTLIIDEAHERSLNIDFLLGYLRQLLPRRPDLKVIVTSATIDPDRFAKHFVEASNTPAPIIEVSGRVYPVETRYRPLVGHDLDEDLDEDEPDLQDAILRAVDELAAAGMPEGDILIFLSGEREIRETAENLRKHHPASTQILPLYARLSMDEQQRVFRVTPGVRRIVLATNVAETSLTVPGIRYVIDPGFARISHYSPRTKVQRLPIEAISQASANQRKGRCGRLSDGVCIRLYSQKDFDERAPFTDPEILRTNLAAVILQMAALRLGRVDRFPFIEPPDPRMIRDGYETLVELGAIKADPNDAEPRLTDIGQRLSRLPVDPRIARIIIAGEAEHCLAEALIVAGALSVQDPRERPIEFAEKADQAHALFADPESDFVAFLKLWGAYHEQKKHLTGSKLRKWCKEHFISYVRMREWHDVHSQLKELAGELGLKTGVGPRVADSGAIAAQPQSLQGPPKRLNRPASSSKPESSNPKPDSAPLHRALLTGLLSSVGTLPEPTKQTTNRFEYHGPRGLRFNIFPGSGLFKKNPKWIVAAEIVKTTKTYARTVASVKPEWIEHAGAHLLKRTHLDPHWDEPRAQVRASERITLFGLELVAQRGVHYGPINPKHAREIFIHYAIIEGQYWSNQPFAKHNKALVAQVDALQHKLRRRDFALDIQARFEFFDKRLPPDTYSGQTFEAWLRGAQRVDPRILFMSLGDLLQPGWGIEAKTLARDYPDQWEVGATGRASEACSFPLEYLYQPGHAADGVTLTAPLPALAILTAQRCEWLIPGYLLEKIIALIRSLPKDIRRSLVPAPDFAARALALMTFGEGDLLASLAHALGRLSGTAISPREFDLGSLAPELRLNIRVIESAPSGAARGFADSASASKGRKILAESRDLLAIQAQLRGQVQATLADAERSPWNRDGLTDWDFDELPRVSLVERAGLRFPAYPALIDLRSFIMSTAPATNSSASSAGESRDAARTVALRLLDAPARADRATRRGIRRLFSLRAREEIRWHIDHAREMHSMLVGYAPIGSPRDFKEDLADLIAGIAFIESDPDPIRSRDSFRRRLERHTPKIEHAAVAAIRLVHGILLARQSLALRFPECVAAPSAPHRSAPTLAPAVSDIRLQLAMLIPSGFIARTAWDCLQHLPRYLLAIERRAQRLTAAGFSAPQRDTPLMDQVRPFWVAYLDRARAMHEQGRDEPAMEEFRWMIEEFRVSLFAQELGTVAPVSAKRLEKKWAEVPE